MTGLRKGFFITFVAALLWAGAVLSRPYVLQPHCMDRPENCAPQAVWAMDQPGLGLENPQADALSDLTQNAAGILAFSAPMVWHGTLAALGRSTPALALSQAGFDFMVILQSVCWNGVGTELAHALFQRPRPFVFAAAEKAKNPSNYTSFYSGHTSFAAAASFALLLMLIARGAPLWMTFLAGAVGQVLILSTAFFRVLAGRHFVSDVLAGAVAGALVACIVASLYRRERN
ncbi:MAG: phosphatase PAP2 family protein [Oligoflexia bacterium]|nr:phosphatase PAP2 family protein [Oligoflexia bacterium]